MLNLSYDVIDKFAHYGTNQLLRVRPFRLRSVVLTFAKVLGTVRAPTLPNEETDPTEELIGTSVRPSVH